MLRRIEDGRADVLARVDNPYVRAMTSRGPVTAYLSSGATGWYGTGIWGPIACAFGTADEVLALLAEAWAKGWLDGVLWYHAPAGLELPGPVEATFDWEFKWTAPGWTATPPAAAQPPTAAAPVTVLTEIDHPAIDAILDAALPDSAVRPGGPGIRAWYGIRAGDRLIACGADQSRSEIGFFGGVAVDPAYQGQGLGTALTLALAGRLHAEYGTVGLAVMGDNPRAGALYDRLGFTGTLRRRAIKLPAVPA